MEIALKKSYFEPYKTLTFIYESGDKVMVLLDQNEIERLKKILNDE